MPRSRPNPEDESTEEVRSFVLSWARSRGLDDENTSSTSSQVALTWRDESLAQVQGLVQDMIASLVRELVGNHKVKFAEDNASTGVDMDFTPPFPAVPLMTFLEKASQCKFLGEELPADDNSCVLLDMLFQKYVPTAAAAGPTFITGFPAGLCPGDDAPGATQRVDLTLKGAVVASVAVVQPEGGRKPEAKVKIFAKELGKIVTKLTDSNLASEALGEEWAQLKYTKLTDVRELLRKMEDVLIDMWKGRSATSANASVVFTAPTARSQSKIVYLMTSISEGLVAYVQAQLGQALRQDKDVWRGPFPDIRSTLTEGLKCAETWLEITEELMDRHWKGEWEGPKHVDRNCKALSDRLEQILNMRSVHEQLLQFLTTQEQLELRVKEVFVLFNPLDPFDLDPARQPQWNAAVAEFDRRLLPIETRVAGKLRQSLASVSNQPHTMMAEFQRHSALIRRPQISQELSQERDSLLVKLSERIDTLMAEFEAKQSVLDNDDDAKKTVEDPQAGRYLPAVVNSIVWARQVRERVTQTMTTCKRMLADLPKMASFMKTCQNFLEDLSAYEKDLYKEWVAGVNDSLHDGKHPIALDTSQPLMTINRSAGGRMEVNFSDRLASLLREVRVLSAMGLVIPQEIGKVCANASKFYRHALAMKKVANYYNNLDKTLTRTHLPILLGHAQKFEALVAQNKKLGITWSKPVEAENYIRRLTEAAQELSTNSRRLQQVHAELAEQVCQLMNTDLLREEEKWAKGVRAMRNRFHFVEHGYGYQNLDQWKTHWDYQLYKALEYQYQRGLVSLNETLTELKCELRFKNDVVEFHPTVGALREQYYTRMKAFIAFPTTFHGVGDSPFFKLMPDRNGEAIGLVYANADKLFRELVKVKKVFRDHVLLGTVDLETLIAENLTEVHQWESSFKTLKAKGKELNQIENVIKVDCISVSTAPVKAKVDDHLQRLGDLLVSSLKKSAQAHVAKIEEFLTVNLEKLDKKPETIDDIGKANQDYTEMREKKPAMQAEFAKFDAKAKLLKNVAGSTPDMRQTKDRWEEFQVKLDNVEKVIEGLQQQMKDNVNAAIEDFLKVFQSFKAKWEELKPKDISQMKTREDCLANGVRFVAEKAKEFAELKERAATLVQQTKYFDMPEPAFSAVEDLDMDLTAMQEMWALYETFDTELQALCKEEWMAFRQHTFHFEDFLKQWGEKLREHKSSPVVLYIRDRLDKWVDLVPLLRLMRGDGFTLDHWLQLFRLAEMDSKMTPEALTFGHVLEKYQVLLDKASDLKALHTRAQGEIQIREALQELRTWAAETEFKLIQRTEGNRTVSLITEWKDLMTSVSDSQALLSSLKDSPYFSRFAEEAGGWETKFVVLDQALASLNSIQRKWVYLEPIFSKGALPAEQARFQNVDKEFVRVMKDIERDRRVVSLAKDTLLPEKLKNVLEQLERCQKALNEFLEMKRDKFPRFYFIGDDDLLEILGQAQNPAVIQTHLKKLFAGIHKVGFSPDSSKIIAIKSADGEEVPLRRPVAVKDTVEAWLGDLDLEMKETLRELLWQCHEKTDFVRYPSQVLCLAENIHFTTDIEKAIADNRLEAAKAALAAQLQEHTSGGEEEDRVQQLKLKALILDLIHNIDVVDQLIAQNAAAKQDWAWQKQLRFYFDDHRACIARMVDSKFAYTYEYQGNAPKLVHTPLTDKCYLTLTQGMHLGYGGNPYGPAGTGKTESVKALGNAMGRQVLVFNCDEGIDFKSMGRIFIGLCKCGAWGCFDEFNRLKEDQLSAISQMIQVIQASLKKGEATTHLLGRTIDLNLNAGIFVTLNPAGKGYGGRSKLPDNLKQLFRAVAMTAPDNALIAETELYSEGFRCAREIGRKMVEIFSLSKQLLSPQLLYDWGLRALKTILRVAGALIHQEKKKLDKGALAKMSKDELFNWESRLIIKAARINTLSKLTHEDSKRFIDLIRDVFPGVAVEDIVYEELIAAVKETLSEMKLQVLDGQLSKVLQLYESLNQRMGVVIVGPSGAGKSTLLKVLRKALQRLGKHIPLYVMNPKAMNREQLLGYMDNDTREWSDGVLTAAARKVVLETLETRSWILCDGDIDPEWIESLNSVLDDNRLLTMPNGERIQFGPNVNFIFETHSMAFASPATVSRMAVIFLSEEDVDPKSAVKSWLGQLPEEAQAMLSGWVNDFFYPAIDLLRKTKAMVVDTTMMALVNSGLSHIRDAKTKDQFVVGLIRGLGSYLEFSKRVEFANAVYKLCRERPMDSNRPLDTTFEDDSLSASLYTYSAGADVDLDGLRRRQLILTIDAQRSLDILKAWVQQQRPFILVGPEGCGKTLLVNSLSAQFKGVSVATINCSAQTTCQHVIQKLSQVCTMFSTNAGRVLRPKDSDRVILFLKDLNLPKPDAYATVQVHAFLQQLILYQGFYNKDLEWVTVERVQVVGSMNPSGGVGRYPLVSRFTAILSVCHISYPPKEQLVQVYSEYLAAFMSTPPISTHSQWGGNKHGEALAATLVSVYAKAKARFTLDKHSHYVFTPRDLSSWVANLLHYDMDSCDLLDVLHYEGCRLFSDRLVTEKERREFGDILTGELSRDWQYFPKEGPMYFVSWLDTGVSKHSKHSSSRHKDKSSRHSKSGKGESTRSGGKKLMGIPAADFAKALAAAKTGFAREFRELDLIDIPETLMWVCRTDRVLAQPGGSLLVT
eukprot:RCo015918